MMACNRVNHLLRCTPELSRICRESNLIELGEIMRSTCTLSGIRNFYSYQHKSRFLEAKLPVSHSLASVQRYTTTVAGEVSEPGILKRLVKKMGWLDHSKSKLRRSGFLLYENIGEKVSTREFFEVCELPDTFFSWFLVTELHVWMIMVRLMAEEEEGRYTRNCLVEALWEDVETRAKKLGDTSPSARQEQIQDIVASFQAALFTYDEGLLGDDKVLASALWRRLFNKKCDDPERLECCVQYVRKQIAYLDGLSRRQFMLECKVEWEQLLERDYQR